MIGYAYLRFLSFCLLNFVLLDLLECCRKLRDFPLQRVRKLGHPALAKQEVDHFSALRAESEGFFGSEKPNLWQSVLTRS